MVTKYIQIPLLLSVITSTVCAKEPFPYTGSIYAVGDSITDSGNAPDTPVTNGHTWAKHFADTWQFKDVIRNGGGAGYDLDSSFPNTSNYAYGGASSKSASKQILRLLLDQKIIDVATYNANSPLTEDPIDINALSSQVSKSTNRLDKHKLYLVYSGGNDILSPILSSGSPENAAAVVIDYDGIANNLVNAIKLLQKAGARHLVIGNIGSAKLTPSNISGEHIGYFDRRPDDGKALNTILTKKLLASSIPVALLDFRALQDHVVANPALYHFTNVTHGGHGQPNVNDYFFYDDVHLTDRAHKTVADYATAALRSPFLAAQLLQHTKSLAQAHRQMGYHWQGLQPQSPWEVGFATLYGQTRGGGRGIPTAASVAASYHTDQGRVMLTSHFGTGRHQHALGHFRASHLGLGAQGWFKQDRYYAQAGLQWGHVNFGHIQRRFNLGERLGVEAHGKTQGTFTDAYAQVGMNFIDLTQWRMGPYLTLDHQWLHVRGYDERDGEPVNMHFEAQKHSVTHAGIGWQMAWQPKEAWSANLALSAAKAWQARPRYVRYRLTTVAPLAEAPIDMHNSTEIDVNTQIQYQFNRHWRGQFSYHWHGASKDIRQHLWQLKVSYFI